VDDIFSRLQLKVSERIRDRQTNGQLVTVLIALRTGASRGKIINTNNWTLDHGSMRQTRGGGCKGACGGELSVLTAAVLAIACGRDAVLYTHGCTEAQFSSLMTLTISCCTSSQPSAVSSRY